MPSQIPIIHSSGPDARMSIDSRVTCSNGNSNAQHASQSHRRLPLPAQPPPPAPLAAQEQGLWRASNSSAKSITGDIALSDEKLNINFVTFTMVRVRSLEKAELGAAFDADTTVAGAGNLFRLNIPAARKFLHKNSLCGAEDTEWMATYTTGRSLRIAFFSGEKPPVFTLSAISIQPTCAAYSNTSGEPVPSLPTPRSRK